MITFILFYFILFYNREIHRGQSLFCDRFVIRIHMQYTTFKNHSAHKTILQIVKKQKRYSEATPTSHIVRETKDGYMRGLWVFHRKLHRTFFSLTELYSSCLPRSVWISEPCAEYRRRRYANTHPPTTTCTVGYRNVSDICGFLIVWGLHVNWVVLCLAWQLP